MDISEVRPFAASPGGKSQESVESRAWRALTLLVAFMIQTSGPLCAPYG